MHLVFSLSENSVIWSKLRSKLRQFLVRKGLLNEVLCALLLQRDKAMDFKTYTDLLLIYVSCDLVFSLFENPVIWSNLKSKFGRI